ncbi:MAG TPA: tannase/feruloyl esterase family alpha/beta hydrolase [Roseateles sp.]|uniref:tannase/feruloyl esterase family alpha/beta hydrolase n=1 Tax=Roseateles sp. TaxID=1971397 RepID=UPI002ED9BAE3
MTFHSNARATARAVPPLKLGRLAALIALGGMAAHAGAQTIPGPANCAALVGMQVESGTVVAAERFAQGATIAGTANLFGGDATTTVSTNFCRVKLQLKPTPSSLINVEAWLPETWNGKMFGYGGGGQNGGLGQSAALMNASAKNGYASATSDVGHATNSSAEWAYNQPEKIIDWGHRANHLVAVTAKQLMNAFYQRPVQRAYFQGCSGGGREAMMQVSRYPADYDGVIAGAPAMDWGPLMSMHIWTEQIRQSVPWLGTKFSAIKAAVMKACDKNDGVQDGVIENPKACKFDPVVLQCTIFDTNSCLNKSEVAAMRKLYEGPKLTTGELLIPGYSVGTETSWGISHFLNMLGGGPEYYKWMVYNDPSWTTAGFYLDVDVVNSRARVEPNVNSSNPDIGAFIQRGGKLLMHHGWSDSVIPSENTVRYYDKLRSRFPSIANNARLFMVPGAEHCAIGFDPAPVLEKWVEQGQAPERLINTVTTSTLFGTTTTTHPLCAWPKVAKYNGTGSTTDAANFTCADPQ